MMNKEQALNLLEWRGLPFIAQTFFNITIIGRWLIAYVENVSTVTQETTRQKLNKEFQPFLPDVQSAIKAAFIAPEKADEIREILHKHGIKDEYIDLMFLSNYSLYDPATVQAQYLRGEMTIEKVYERLREMGFTDTRIKEMMTLWNVIPPIPDLIRFAVREAFTPEIAEKFGQYEDFPQPVAEWGAKQGLSEEWSKKYWAAHWELPSIQMGYDLLHRGLIKREELELLLRALDIMPFWREKLVQLSYNPFTRVDVRRMHKTGILSEDEVYQSYLNIGYNDEKALKMTQFTLALNAGDDKNLTLSQVTKAYKKSIITHDEAKDMILKLKYNDDQAEFFIAQIDFDEQLDLQDDYLAAAQKRYVNNLWDENATRLALTKLNLTGTRIDALITKWKPARELDFKVPSKTDLDKFLKNKIITEDAYKMEMYRLGYSALYTDWYLTLIQKGKAGN